MIRFEMIPSNFFLHNDGELEKVRAKLINFYKDHEMQYESIGEKEVLGSIQFHMISNES